MEIPEIQNSRNILMATSLDRNIVRGGTLIELVSLAPGVISNGNLANDNDNNDN